MTVREGSTGITWPRLHARRAATAKTSREDSAGIT